MRMRMQPMPVGEAGGSKAQGQAEPEGDHPACTSEARKVGEPGLNGQRLYPCAARGAGPLAKAIAEGAALGWSRTSTRAWANADARHPAGDEHPLLLILVIRERDRYRMAGTTGPVRCSEALAKVGA